MDVKNLIEGLGEKRDEILKKATQCKSAEELLDLAKEYNISITEIEAAELFETMNSKSTELTDGELDSVAGGCFSWKFECPKCHFPFHKCNCKK